MSFFNDGDSTGANGATANPAGTNWHDVQLVISPDGAGGASVTFELDRGIYGGTGIIDAYTLPPSVYLGFTGRTGGATNNHWVKGVTVSTGRGQGGGSCHAGLQFEGYEGVHPTNLASVEATVFDEVWEIGTPTVSHEEHTAEIFYSNDQAFVDEIEGFAGMDNYVMRWRGQITIATPGEYTFKTSSDDGSRLYIDSALVVDNDGDHGRQDRDGAVTLTAGLHDITIAFYENGGGSILEVSWTPTPGDAALAHLGGSVLSNSVGCPAASGGTTCSATMYQHGGYQGWQAQFNDGDYPLAQFLAHGANDNDGSSLVVTGGDTCIATVYENGDFTGWSRELGVGSYDCCSSFPNDQPSSIKVHGSTAATSTTGSGGANSARFTNVVPGLTGGNCAGGSNNGGDTGDDRVRQCGAVSQSTMGWGGEPDRAIDGNTATSWGGGSCSHTGNFGGQSWFQVDLGSFSTVDRVAVYHRTDCCQDRLESAAIYISDTPDFNTGVICGGLNDHTQEPESSSCGGAAEGQFVTVALARTGLQFEAYENVHFDNLAAVEATIHDTVWEVGTPTAAHEEHTADLWYSNDQAFVNELADFVGMDNYAMRWRGQIAIATAGEYIFKTSSDDGSRLYIDGVMIVDNDGDHARVDVQGTVTLTAGPHDITIAFYEHGGGSILEVSWTPTPGAPLAHLGGSVLTSATIPALMTICEIEIYASTGTARPTGTAINLVPALAGGNCQGPANPSSGPRICGAASQSSMGWSGEPDRAIDGDTNTVWGGGSCSHTADVDGESWFQLDLGQVALIDSVAIYHRTDCCQDRLESARIFISESPNYSSGVRCGGLTDHSQEPERAQCGGSAEGRYVTLSLRNGAGANGVRALMTICEMEVMGFYFASPAVYTNLVPGLQGTGDNAPACANDAAGFRVCGAVSQDSIGWGGEPIRAVDGNRDTNYGGASCSHTNSGGGAAWFQVDLGSVNTIDRVAIYHRTDCCGDRLESALVIVSSVPDFNNGVTCGQVSDHTQEPEVSQCGGAAEGRYVTVDLAGGGGGTSGGNLITICEIEIYGAPVFASNNMFSGNAVDFIPLIAALPIQIQNGTCHSGIGPPTSSLYEFAGGSALDGAGTHHGTITGATSVADRNGVASNAFHFDGISQFITVPTPFGQGPPQTRPKPSAIN